MTKLSSPKAKSPMPNPTSLTSPTRRRTRAAVTPPAIAPAPCKELNTPKKDVDRAVALLHRRLLLTSSHLVAQDVGWSALAHDLVGRKWRLPEQLPAVEEARRELASLLLARAGELTAADLSGALGWKRTLCASVLDELAPSRQEADFRIWTAP